MPTFAKAVDNYKTTLRSSHTAGDSTLLLAVGTGATLGTLGANQIFRVTALSNPDTPSEVVLAVLDCTGISTDDLTGVAASAGYTNPTLPSGTAIQVRMVAQDATDLQTAVNANAAAVAARLVAASNLGDLASAATARTNLGLGTLATQAASAAAITGGAIDGATIGATAPVQAQAYRPINAQTGTAYTLVLGDDGKLVTLSNAAAITLTVPPNSSVAFPVGAEVDLIQVGAGQATLIPGAGVTISSYQSKLGIVGQYAGATLKKTATDTWVLVGNLA